MTSRAGGVCRGHRGRAYDRLRSARGHVPERPDDTRGLAGDYERAHAHCDEAALARGLGSRRIEAIALFILAEAALHTHRYLEVREVGGRALELARDIDDGEAMALALIRVAWHGCRTRAPARRGLDPPQRGARARHRAPVPGDRRDLLRRARSDRHRLGRSDSRSAAPRRSGVSTPGKRRPAPPRRRRRARPGARSSSADVAPRRHRTGARGRQPTRPGRGTHGSARCNRLANPRQRLPPMEGEIQEATAALVRSLEAGDAATALASTRDDAKLLAPGRPDPWTSRDRGILAHRNRPGAHGRRVRASGARSGRRERGGDRSLRRLGQRRRRRASP